MIFPDAQARHDVAPPVANLPASQSLQLPAVAMLAANFPFSQRVQAAEAAPEYDPAEQSEHDDASALLNVPARHPEQPELEHVLGLTESVQTLTLLYPARHPTQAEAPDDIASLPLGHVVHDDEPSS